MTQWNPANYELAASDPLADLLRHKCAELYLINPYDR